MRQTTAEEDAVSGQHFATKSFWYFQQLAALARCLLNLSADVLQKKKKERQKISFLIVLVPEWEKQK